MRVHHLSAATLCPPFASSFRHDGRAEMVCHCLLVEAPDRLVLVDTGLGTADLADPVGRLGWGFKTFTRPVLDPALTAVEQIRRLGFSPEDVRDIVLTHLDLDHAGGLSDFPHARAHVMMAEQEAAVLRTSLREKERYRKAHIDAWPTWSLYAPKGEPWFGFDAVRSLQGLPPEILLIPLTGHSRGHAGVAVEGEAGWLLHAGDAYFHRDELAGKAAPALLEGFQRLMAMDGAKRVHNRDRLVQLAREHAGEVKVFCAHDPVELAGFGPAGAGAAA